MTDDIKGIVGAIFGVVVLIIFVGAMVPLFTSLGDQQCQPYKDTIAQKDSQISGLNGQFNSVSNQLAQCQSNYETLIRENITKKDIEEIKGYYNVTQVQINNLEQRIDQTNTNYFNFYKVLISNYRLSLTFNIAIGVTLLSFEILSFAFLKTEFVMFVINSAKHHRRKKKEEKDGENRN